MLKHIYIYAMKIDKKVIIPKCSGKMDYGYITSRYKIKN